MLLEDVDHAVRRVADLVREARCRSRRRSFSSFWLNCPSKTLLKALSAELGEELPCVAAAAGRVGRAQTRALAFWIACDGVLLGDVRDLVAEHAGQLGLATSSGRAARG